MDRMKPHELDINFIDDYDDLDACAVCNTYVCKGENYISGYSYNYKGCVITIHPKGCKKSIFDAAIQLLHHEILHHILTVEVGNKASHRWDNIAGNIAGCPCR